VTKTMRAADLPTMPVADLIPYARNSRTHSDAQVAQIAASITEFGFTNPVLVDAKGSIIAGHGRVLAARKLKLKAVPVLVLDHLTDAQRRAYVIADNKLSENSTWDLAVLTAEMVELAGLDFDLEMTGFTMDELDNLISEPEEYEPVLTPTADYRPVTEAQVERGAEKINDRYTNASQQKTIEVMCPHCAKEFYIQEP